MSISAHGLTPLGRPFCTCPAGRAQHERDCRLWTAKTCECDPLGEGLGHHRWCGQHPDNATYREPRHA